MNDTNLLAETIDLAVCICTRNRPEDLAKALNSVAASSMRVCQVIVADDSTDARTKQLIEEEFPGVDFVEGPRRGLCANRNAALRLVREPHVSFLDDDALLGHDFVAKAAAALRRVPVQDREQIIVTGLERQRGQLIYPKDQTFLGYQQRNYDGNERMNTVVINATVFPTALFEKIGFDTNLVYGCDEVDLTTRAVALGYTIKLCADAVNDHFPSPVNRDFYQQHLNASRLYVTLKRYAITQRSYAKAALFAIIAPLHLNASLMKRSGKEGLRASFASIIETFGYVVKYYRRRPDTAARTARSVMEPVAS